MTTERWAQVCRQAAIQRARDAKVLGLPSAMVPDDDHGMEMLARLFLWATCVFAVVAIVVLRFLGVL